MQGNTTQPEPKEVALGDLLNGLDKADVLYVEKYIFPHIREGIMSVGLSKFTLVQFLIEAKRTTHYEDFKKQVQPGALKSAFGGFKMGQVNTPDTTEKPKKSLRAFRFGSSTETGVEGAEPH